MWPFRRRESQVQKESALSSGKRILTDAAAASANDDLPAFLAKPEGAPVYHGFPLVEASRVDGWCFGMITAVEDGPEGCEWGDAFVEAPDGTRAGLVWSVGDFATEEVCPPTPDRWGVYSVAFPDRVHSVAELIECFHRILPELKAVHGRVAGPKLNE